MRWALVPVVIVSSPEIVGLTLKTYNHVFADRSYHELSSSEQTQDQLPIDGISETRCCGQLLILTDELNVTEYCSPTANVDEKPTARKEGRETIAETGDELNVTEYCSPTANVDEKPTARKEGRETIAETGVARKKNSQKLEKE
nr:cytochrome P450 CYP736A12-like [Ipomoea trifida]